MSRPTGISILLGILIAATLAGVAAFVHWNFVYFPPAFTGWGEVTSDGTVSGWAIYRKDAGQRVEVALYVNDQFIGYADAELPRPDVVQAGWTSDARCGYRFPLPKLPAGDHVARVYALHRLKDRPYMTLQITGEPLKFSVTPDGATTPLK